MPEMPAFAEMIKMRAVLRIPGMEDVAARRDLVYKTLADETLLFDLYSPKEPAPRPAVVLIHGGPVPAGSGPKGMGSFLSIGELVAASGLAAIVFNHRFHGAPMLVDAAGDVRDLLRHVRESAADLGIDPERIALWAFSGGGPFLSSTLKDAPGYVRALVAYYALLDMQVRPSGVEPGSPNDLSDETRRAYSPAYHVASGARVPPMLIARAGLDHPWLNGSIDRFVASALEKNAPLDLMNHAAGRHGFDILDDDDRSREILARTLAFLTRALL